MKMTMTVQDLVVSCGSITFWWVFRPCNAGFTDQQSSIIHVPEHTRWVTTTQLTLLPSTHTWADNSSLNSHSSVIQQRYCHNGVWPLQSSVTLVLLYILSSLYIKCGKVSIRTKCTFVHNAGRGQLSSEWRDNENDVTMTTAGLQTYGKCQHVTTGCKALLWLIHNQKTYYYQNVKWINS